MFYAIFLIIGFILFLITRKIYVYTYHFGYLIALCSVLELAFLAYGIRYIILLYNGDYLNYGKNIPLYILAGSFSVKFLLNLCYLILILTYYLNDIRYREWKETNPLNFRLSVIFVLIFGIKFYKLYYSKLFGK